MVRYLLADLARGATVSGPEYASMAELLATMAAAAVEETEEKYRNVATLIAYHARQAAYQARLMAAAKSG